MLRHLAASKEHGEYFNYYLQGHFLSLDHINHLLLSDELEVIVFKHDDFSISQLTFY
jgi:hypothetical protein